MGMPPVQKAALAMLPKLAPTHLPQVKILRKTSLVVVAFPCRRAAKSWVRYLHTRSQRPSVCFCLQLYPDYIYSIVRLLRPEHVIEQWQEQQLEAVEGTAAAYAAQQQFSIPAEPPAVQPPTGGSLPQPLAGNAASSVAGHAELANGGSPALISHSSGTVKQPPGQVGQARFALTSAFLEKVGGFLKPGVGRQVHCCCGQTAKIVARTRAVLMHAQPSNLCATVLGLCLTSPCRS